MIFNDSGGAIWGANSFTIHTRANFRRRRAWLLFVQCTWRSHSSIHALINTFALWLSYCIHSLLKAWRIAYTFRTLVSPHFYDVEEACAWILLPGGGAFSGGCRCVYRWFTVCFRDGWDMLWWWDIWRVVAKAPLRLLFYDWMWIRRICILPLSSVYSAGCVFPPIFPQFIAYLLGMGRTNSRREGSCLSATSRMSSRHWLRRTFSRLLPR